MEVLIKFMTLASISLCLMGKMPSSSKQISFSFYDDATICRTTAGLTKSQIKICYQQPDTTVIALQGLNEAIKECQYQFQNHRWNCSSLSTRAKNPYTSSLLTKGYRESAFAYAISSAGISISIAKACSQGTILNCGCDVDYKYKKSRKMVTPSTAWKWGGCSHNVHYGVRFSKIFLDSRESAGDIHSIINLHNNHVGRTIVTQNMQIKCKCHGMSGSCELKTCWYTVPDFHTIGKILKERYKNAIMVDQSNLGNRNSKKIHSNNTKKKTKYRILLKQFILKQKHKRNLNNQLLYYQKSPNYCEKNTHLDILGTSGRFCNRTNISSDSCSNLCCGRGYNLVKQKRIEHCLCKFRWCCNVECQICNIEEWISVCK